MRKKEQEAEKKLSRQGAEYKTLQRDFQRCTEHIEQLNAVAKKKQLQIARLKEAEGQLTDMKKRCREGEELIKKAQEREAALVEELAGLQNDNAFLHDSISKQREMNEELEGKVGKITSEMAKTRQEACQVGVPYSALLLMLLHSLFVVLPFLQVYHTVARSFPNPRLKGDLGACPWVWELIREVW